MFKFALALILSTSAFAQAPMFRVENPDKLYNEVEASRSYWYAVTSVETEYHIRENIAPSFTLKLGAKANGIDFNNSILELTSWDKRYFRMGVMGLTINKMLDPENLKRLELRIEAQEKAQADWHELLPKK